MKDEEILLTEHAKIKIHERSISLAMVEQVIVQPELTKIDKFDNLIVHYIKKVEGKYLRVLARSEKNKKIIITAFFDRRFKEGDKK